MSYIFKQKLNLADLVEIGNEPKRVLIYEPQSDLGALYAYYLKEYNFSTEHCLNEDVISQYVIRFRPHLLIFSADGGSVLPKTGLIAASLIKEFPDLSLVSTGYNLNGQGIGELMSLGVISHINRRLSRPQDLALIVKTILNNN